MTTDVRNGAASGWLLKKTDETTTGTITFTSNNGTIANAPTLVLVYEPG